MAGALWGLLLKRAVRDASRHRQTSRPTRIGGIGVADLSADISVDTRRQNDRRRAERRFAMSGSATGAGVDGRRWHDCGDKEISAAHEVSCHADGRRGMVRGRTPRIIIAPPQHGQRLTAMIVRSGARDDARGAGAAKSLRQSASFSVRRPLARKP